jgi:Ni/Fe-hydrogenase subunit HybB-like protein
MTVFEAYHSARAYGFPFEIKMLSSLVKIIPYVLGLYLVIRLGEFFITGKYMYLFQDPLPGAFWLAEIIGGGIIPLIYFADPKMRNDPNGIIWGAYFTIGGLILNRINSALIFMNGSFYLPSWSELAVTLGLTCLGIIIFDATVRFLPLFPEPKPERTREL